MEKRGSSSFLSIILLLLFCFILPLRAQFNGDFGIEKHFLEEENFLDWKAYQDLISWRYDWYEAQNGIKVNVGSLSQERFFWHEEIRFQIEFNDAISFLYELEQDEFYRTMSPYQEGEFRFGKDFAFSILGFPPHEKMYHNLGFALSYGRRASLEYVRFSHLRTHSGFNDIVRKDEKVSGDEEYLREPGMNRLEAQYLIKQCVLFELDLKHEGRIEFLVPDENAKKNYRGFDYLARLDWRINERWLAGTSLQTFQEKRWHVSTVSADFTDQVMDMNGLDLYARVRITENDHLTFGFLDSSFGNDIDSNDIQKQYKFSLESSQIYCIWQNDRSDRIQMFYSLQIGTFDLYKEDEGAVDTEDDGVDIKAGIGVVISENARYRFLALSTWDLDLFTTRQWDGGCIQLQIYF